MRKKFYWGLGAFIILFIAVGSFVFYQQWTELQHLKQEVAASDKQGEDPLAKSDKPRTKDDLPAANPGFKWVQHGDHFHQVPIDAPDEWQEETDTESISHQTVNTVPILSSASEGTSLFSKVAASDEVPKYAELKQMTIQELGKLMKDSYAKSNSYDAEVERLWKEFADAPVGSDEEKAARASLDTVLKEQFVHQITGDKASKTWAWLVGIERSKTPHLWVSWVLPEPFDE